MKANILLDQHDACSLGEKAIVALLVISDEPLGKTKLLEYLRKLGIRDSHGKVYAAGPLGESMSALRNKGCVADVQGSGFVCADALRMPAIRASLDDGSFERLCSAIESGGHIHTAYDGSIYLRTYRQGLARLRLALLRGQPLEKIYPWLAACMMFRDFGKEHPYVTILGRPFEPALMDRLHPDVQAEVMEQLLQHAMTEAETAAPLREWAQRHLVQDQREYSPLTWALAEHQLVRGELDNAYSLIKDATSARAGFTRAAILLLRGDTESAAAGFDAALKALRKEHGKRNILIPGIYGHLYVFAMIRSADPKYRKQADTYLDLMRRGSPPLDHLVYAKLQTLRLFQAGALPAEAALELERVTDAGMWPQLLQVLLYYWFGLPEVEKKTNALSDIFQRAKAIGFHFFAAQAAGLLGRLGDAAYAEQADALRRQYGFADLCDWFERQEVWQRQLSALAGLQGANESLSKTEAQSRLAWMISYDPKYDIGHVEPREQKRDARGNWTKGRAVALKRLHDSVDQLGFMTSQDMRVSAAIGMSASYYQGPSYSIDAAKAMAALVGHPLVFWCDAPDVRVELVRGEPELLIKESAGKVCLSLQPPIDVDTGDVLITKETPTRLRVFSIGKEHRRIAAIVGQALTVPPQAKQQVLQAVSSLSSLITVQSDIGGGAVNVEQVEADRRLHVHLLPYEAGLKMQILVKPFADGGPYYAPGQGTESVIAEVGGKRLQARRDLGAERAAATRLIDACPVLESATETHGEWLLTEPQSCLELLLQLQAAAQGIVIAWPEGEKFKVTSQLGSRQMRLAVKSERDWFAASGELRVDENTVLDLRQLLELVRQSPGRFVALGGNQFLALTEEFHRRLSDLAAFGDLHGQQLRVHPLASFALEELSDTAGAFKSDKNWKQHLARLQEVDTLEPQVPATLAAELRDYQLTGFHWLARLAHWGVGACLADDMGLGKTVQTLALLLARAPQGPALVVAPTSVCLNWVSEITRFAPTLNVMVFGAGDRSRMLADLQPFDLVVASYGLVQQEAELFSGVQWHTIVLDEAQAIKNALTKRSQAVMALKGDFRMVVTGTPLENHLGELWNLFRFINPGLLGSLEKFNERFAHPIEKQQDAGARARLRRLIQPFILRRTKLQVLSELPSRTEIVHQVELSSEEVALYEALRRSALEKLAEVDAPASKKSLQILAEIMKLRRACCNPQLVAPELGLASSKLAAFGELLDELLENRHKALVFSQFVDHLSLIRAYLDQRGIPYQYLDGATPMQERKKRVDAFQAGEGDVFLISLKAGGTGLNLTAADYVIHMDPWWNPAVEDQASDRAHRMGQQRPVTIYRLVARHTIEEAIVDLHKHKRALADSLLEGSDVAGKMSVHEMLKLLQQNE